MKTLLDLRAAARERRPELPELPELRDAAIATWRARMVNEHQSAQVFGALASQARRLGLAATVVEQLSEFEDEERKHGVLCGAVVESLGGEARAAVTTPRSLPEHADCAPLEAFLRNVLSVSCLSETVAVALIGAERLEMPQGPLRELLSEIWADEVGHARFGWRVAQELLPLVDSAAKLRLSLYLRVALRHLELHELEHLPLASRPAARGAALGLCNGADARTLFYQTVADAILPALENLGLEAALAWTNRASADGLRR
ncbi:MAG TPA: ferritin-like domain-containing protein [Polyangiaceae bacterium]|nr:ferritin-like domain-containing protein [Polyangiaceae bacterium]